MAKLLNPINSEDKKKEIIGKIKSIQVDLLESTDQIYDLDNFINTGMALTYVSNNEKRSKENEKDFPLLHRIITN